MEPIEWEDMSWTYGLYSELLLAGGRIGELEGPEPCRRRYQRHDATFKTDSLYLWFRNTMTMVITISLLRVHNPLIADPNLIDFLWYANYTSQVWTILTSLGTSRKEFWYFSSEYSHNASHPKLTDATLPSSLCLVHTTPPSSI